MSENQEANYNNVPAVEIEQPAVIVDAEIAASNSKKMVCSASAFCVVSVVIIIILEYYSYLRVYSDDDNGGHVGLIITWIVAIGMAIIATILGSLQIRNLPRESREKCKIGIIIVCVTFTIAAAILFVVWVTRSEDDSPTDDDDAHSKHGLTTLVGSIAQIVTLIVVTIYFCVAYCITKCCTPPVYQSHQSQMV